MGRGFPPASGQIPPLPALLIPPFETLIRGIVALWVAAHTYIIKPVIHDATKVKQCFGLHFKNTSLVQNFIHRPKSLNR